MTLNERLITLAKQQVGNDPTFTMVLTMFEGNILSIPEEELRANLEKYIRMMTECLNGVMPAP